MRPTMRKRFRRVSYVQRAFNNEITVHTNFYFCSPENTKSLWEIFKVDYTKDFIQEEGQNNYLINEAISRKGDSFGFLIDTYYIDALESSEVS